MNIQDNVNLRDILVAVNNFKDTILPPTRIELYTRFMHGLKQNISDLVYIILAPPFIVIGGLIDGIRRVVEELYEPEVNNED